MTKTMRTIRTVRTLVRLASLLPITNETLEVIAEERRRLRRARTAEIGSYLVLGAMLGGTLTLVLGPGRASEMRAELRERATQSGRAKRDESPPPFH